MPDPAHPSYYQVLEEPEPEAKLVKPPPVATAPVQTFTPKAGCLLRGLKHAETKLEATSLWV